MHPKDADGMANSVDSDQTASSEVAAQYCCGGIDDSKINGYISGKNLLYEQIHSFNP